MRRRPPRPGRLQILSPLRILTQILTLQLLHYLIGTVLILFTALAAGKHFNADLVLDWRSLRADTTVGWTLGLCWVLDAGASVIFILLFIARSKLVLDFALTVHGIHLVVTSLYTGSVPTNVLWWGLQGVSAGVMVAGGLWACRWRELRPIEFGGGGGAKGRSGEEEVGKGRGRGRGRDGGGEYELVGRGDGDEGEGGSGNGSGSV
ncbi:MAG: hypothetical protein LQ343_003932 [Gyalolechia ehrenbergii]|nr:MAG: hypothetical protein LQ343_003932 [Gyalolechia ehrenbergii]